MIYALTGNTMDSPNGDYFVAFTADFFDTYESATIRYGSCVNDFLLELTLTRDDCVFTEDFRFEGGSGVVPRDDYFVFWFENPYGNGSRHAYLFELVLN